MLTIIGGIVVFGLVVVGLATVLDKLLLKQTGKGLKNHLDDLKD